MQKVRGQVTGEAQGTPLEGARFATPDGAEKRVAMVHRSALVEIVAGTTDGSDD